VSNSEGEGLSAIARTLQFEGSKQSKREKRAAGLILQAAAEVRFNEKLTIAQIVARIRGEP
jgi:hypothetical protein